MVSEVGTAFATDGCLIFESHSFKRNKQTKKHNKTHVNVVKGPMKSKLEPYIKYFYCNSRVTSMSHELGIIHFE